MTDILTLNCWILGDEPGRIFTVEIPGSKTVSILKKAIKEEDKDVNVFHGIGAKLLDLWKVCSVRLLIPDI